MINIPTADEAEVVKELEISGVLKDVANGNDVFAYSEKDYVKRVLAEMFRGFSEEAPSG